MSKIDSALRSAESPPEVPRSQTESLAESLASRIESPEKVLPFPSLSPRSRQSAEIGTKLAPVEAVAPVLGVWDALVIAAGFICLGATTSGSIGPVVVLALVASLSFIQIGRFLETRIVSRPRHRRTMVGRTAVCLGIVAMIVGAAIDLLGIGAELGGVGAICLGAMAAGILGSRAVAASLMRYWRKRGRTVQHVACIGATKIAADTIAAIEANDDHEMAVVGVFDDRTRSRDDETIDLDVRGTVKDLFDLLRRERVDVILIALPWSAERRILDILQRLRNVPSSLVLAPEMGAQLRQVSLGAEQGLSLVEMKRQPLAHGHRIIKESIERLLAFCMLFCGLPVLAAIALAIKLDSRGPVFFRQDRRGFGGNIIRVYKFRSLYHNQTDAHAARQTVKNDPRVTRVGAFLRKTSLDELPQLINVLTGEMSLIGPRPYALKMQVEDQLVGDILEEYLLRHHVKPGITGWAQVNGANGPVHTMNDMIKRTELDVYYIRNWSLGLDLKILLQTVRVVLGGRVNA